MKNDFETKELKWDRRFLRLAEHVAGWSKDPSTQVGCVVVDNETRQVRGIGYNGFPRGVEDTRERYQDRAQKYPRVVHAELNAILNSHEPGRLDSCTLYVTLPPCCECAKAIIQSGIWRVVVPKSLDAAAAARWESSMDVTVGMFQEAGVGLEFA